MMTEVQGVKVPAVWENVAIICTDHLMVLMVDDCDDNDDADADDADGDDDCAGDNVDVVAADAMVDSER